MPGARRTLPPRQEVVTAFEVVFGPIRFASGPGTFDQIVIVLFDDDYAISVACLPVDVLRAHGDPSSEEGHDRI